MRRLFVLPLLLALGSCASLDKGQCLGGDWEGIGLRDGADGAQMSRVDDHAKACATHGVTPDVAAWSRGRERGLLDYCRSDRGFAVGRSGSSYGGVCPPDLEGEFLAAYSDGKLVNAAQRELDRATSEVREEYDRAERIEEEMRRHEARLADTALKPEEREAIRATLKRLRDDRARALDAMERAQWSERRAQRELDDLEARFSAVYGTW